MAMAVALGMAVCFPAMRMVVRAVRVAVSVQDKISDHIGGQSDGANNENELRIPNHRGIDEAGDGFEDNRDAESD